MPKKQKRVFLLYLALAGGMLVSGCIRLNSPGTSTTAGIYKTYDKGEKWQAKNILISPGSISNISQASIRLIRFDPQDNNALYLGTDANGLFYSFNGGEFWEQPNQLSSGRINDLAIDALDKCTIYVAYGHKVMKTVDCNRSWFDVYIDTRPKIVNTIALDRQNPQAVYAGTEFGEVIKSSNGGGTWTTVKRFAKPITQLTINTNNPRILYVLVADEGVYKSSNGGETWDSVSQGLSQYQKSIINSALYFDATHDDAVYLTSSYGIIRTLDGGRSWMPLDLITPPLSAEIYALSINPQNGNEIFYGTASTVYRTTNGGANWSVKKLPALANSAALAIDPVNPSIVYLGLRLIKTQKQ